MKQNYFEVYDTEEITSTVIKNLKGGVNIF